MRPRSWAGCSSLRNTWRMKGTQEHHYMAYLAGYFLPAVFHVLWFIHTYGQFDLQILVGARLGHSHLMEFWLLGAVRSWVEDNLHSNEKRQQKARLHKYLISSCATFRNTNLCLQRLVIMFFLFFFWKWKTKVSQGRETEQCFALSPRRGGLISLCWVKELSCLPANAAAVGDQRALSQTKVTVTTGTSEAPLPERKHVTPPSLTVYHNNLTPQESTGWRTNQGFCFLKSFKVNVQRLEMFKDWKSDKREYISVGFCSNTSIMRKYQNEKRLL